MGKKLDKRTAVVVLSWVSWMEFILGTPITDYLGNDDDFTPNKEELERFAQVLEEKGTIDDIKPEDIWE